MLSQLDALQRPRPVDFRRLPRGFHSVAKQASFRIAFRSDFERIWKDLGFFSEAEMGAKIDFGSFFCHGFSDRVLASILNGFLEARNLKNHCFSLGKSMIFIKSTLSKKYRKMAHLGFVFGCQNRRKIDKTRC